MESGAVGAGAEEMFFEEGTLDQRTTTQQAEMPAAIKERTAGEPRRLFNFTLCAFF